MRMRTSLRLLPLLAGCTASGGSPRAEPVDLVVVLVVDQLAPGILERYEPALGGGLRRLLEEGRVFTNAVHDHASTSTAPGHASLSTGTLPSRHGVVGNSWRTPSGRGFPSIYSFEDLSVTLVGANGEGRSPANLQRTGLADWLLERDPTARVVSVAGKDRSAIGLAGHARGHVYWYDDEEGRFITSTYYRDALPAWVQRVNDGALPKLDRDSCWTSTVPPEHAALSRPDTVVYEFDGVNTHFPHCFSEAVYGIFPEFVARTPLLDEATFALARAAITALELGRRGTTDYLALGLSSTDRVGHRFGPFSREQLDNILRLDRQLGELLALLDETVGPGRHVVALSADHGAIGFPEYRVEQGLPGLRNVGRAVSAALDSLARAYAGLEPAERNRRVVAGVERLDFVAQAVPLEAIAGHEAAADSFVRLYRNSYYPGRLSSDLARHGVEIRLTEGTRSGSSGTGHGTPYLHDRWVPLMVMGPGVPPGRDATRVRTVDLAPTLARVAGAPVPNDLDGRPLLP